ncbi:MAG: hypothetical protein E3J86_09690 [Candidatus Thorarchaeota archaeon]|nr:MAG: hypothetical protein E3J86_09690 [Candidatus Thorarchaeota archaeon]
MSHHEGAPPEDAYYVNPKDVLSQFSVEWIALRKTYDEIKKQLLEVQADLSHIDRRLESGDISDSEHIVVYREKWSESTQIVQVKREVENRLYEIQKEIRAANKQLKLAEEERVRRERMEETRSIAMIEWMSLKQGFDLTNARRNEINADTDKLELERRKGKTSDEEYRQRRIEQFRQLAELSIVESDVKRRLAELLEIIRK